MMANGMDGMGGGMGNGMMPNTAYGSNPQMGAMGGMGQGMQGMQGGQMYGGNGMGGGMMHKTNRLV